MASKNEESPTRKLTKVVQKIWDRQKTLIPIGTIVPFGSDKEKPGWHPCDGKSLETTKYRELYAVIGVSFGSADVRHFNLPDLRGRFVRGVDQGVGRDPDAETRGSANPGGQKGDAVGSVQDDAFQDHKHLTHAVELIQGRVRGGGGKLHKSAGDKEAAPGEVTASSDTRVSKETRPKNLYVNWLIYAGVPGEDAIDAELRSLLGE